MRTIGLTLLLLLGVMENPSHFVLSIFVFIYCSFIYLIVIVIKLFQVIIFTISYSYINPTETQALMQTGPNEHLSFDIP